MTGVIISAIALVVPAKFFFHLAKHDRRSSWLWAGTSLAIGCLVHLVAGFGLLVLSASQFLLFAIMWGMNLTRDDPVDF